MTDMLMEVLVVIFFYLNEGHLYFYFDAFNYWNGLFSLSRYVKNLQGPLELAKKYQTKMMKRTKTYPLKYSGVLLVLNTYWVYIINSVMDRLLILILLYHITFFLEL